MTSSWASPGVKCVCVDGSRRMLHMPNLPPIPFGGVLPVIGQIYTVRSVEWYESPYPEITPSFLGIHLVEIDRPPGKMTGSVLPFFITRFRPLVSEREERDLALFTPLLDSTPEKV
jgi:hypothetical protein